MRSSASWLVERSQLLSDGSGVSAGATTCCLPVGGGQSGNVCTCLLRTITRDICMQDLYANLSMHVMHTYIIIRGRYHNCTNEEVCPVGALATFSPIVSYSARRALWRKNCSILPKVIRKRRNDSVSLCLSLSLSVCPQQV